MNRLILVFAMITAVAAAQTENSQNAVANQNGSRQITIPAGTKVLLHLRSPINTKNARVGDDVYCETAFPVTQDNVMVIPPRTYVKGSIMHVVRPGRIKGRAELQVHFTTLIFPNGYTVQLPGSLENAPGAEHAAMSDQEGTVKADGQKGKAAGTVAKTAGSGAAIGAVVDRSVKGAAVGGGIGGAVGLATVLFTRGQDIRFETGTALEMVLQRPLTVDPSHAAPSHGYN